MIRNYQRAGGAAVDLTPIYNSLNAIQNEINSLITITDLSTLTSISAGISAFTGSISSISQSVNMLISADEMHESSIRVNSSAINSLSLSMTGLNASFTALSTEFTSHTSLFDYRYRTLESSLSSAINSLSSSVTLNDAKISALAEDSASLRVSINSLSSSILDINSIISTLSTGGGGGGIKTITNPTETDTVFTDAVLYSGTISGDFNPYLYPKHNTYMRGVTWRDSPSTTLSGTEKSFAAMMANCLVYGDMSFINVYNGYIQGVTASNIVLSQCDKITVSTGCAIGTVSAINVTSPGLWHGTHNSVQINSCVSAIFNGVNVNQVYSPDCKYISMDSCRIRDIIIEYPTTVTRNTTDYSVYMARNTIDMVNVMALTVNARNNDIWTANIYLDYDLMQITRSENIPGDFVNNVINELSIFNHDRRSINTTNPAISMNGLNFMTNTISHLRVDLYCPITIWSNSIDTLEHTLGVFVSAMNNAILEWDCEIAPFSMKLHDRYATKSLAMAWMNTIGKWNVFHGITDESLFTDRFAPIVTNGLNQLILDISYNSIDYVTFDVLNPLNISFTSGISSALLHVGNSLNIMCPDTIMTLDIVNAELFSFDGGRRATLRIFDAHSLGLTNIFPEFSTGASIDSLNWYMDSTMLNGYSFTNATINTANIAAFGPVNLTAPFVIGGCNITYLDYNQRNGQNIELINNTIDYCSITGGSVKAWTNTISNVVINARSANLANDDFYGLAGTVSGLTANTCLLSLGGFYYGHSTGQSNTINRLATGF